MSSEKEVLLEVKNLSKTFPLSKKRRADSEEELKAVSIVSFKLYKGETLGIVGESGSGKSTIAKLILQLLHPSEGAIHFLGADLTKQKGLARKEIKRKMQAVFQDPYASLNPRMRAKEIITEPLLIHKELARRERDTKALSLLAEVGLGSQHMDRYPHEFSGGQRQRLSIARAIALKPDLIVCDEAVSALDVSIQAQILNVLKHLQKTYGVSYLFIAHGLPVVKHISSRVGIMRQGELVEIGTTEQIFNEPTHLYTKSLLSAVPPSHPRERQTYTNTGGSLT